MLIIRSIFIILILGFSSVACSGGLEGFKFKKKSASGDEFLIQKKDPLVLPPDYSKLPNPDEKINAIVKEETQVETIFKNDNPEKKETKNTEQSNSSLEQSILKKIQKK